MKTTIKVFLCVIAGILISTVSLKAQDNKSIAKGGVYQTEQDYKLNTLSYVLGQHDKLESREFLEGKNLVVVNGPKKITLAKKDIFGYNLHHQNFRLYRNESYRILDTAGFVLYSLKELTPQAKGSKIIEHHFYSLNLHEPIQELTVQNLWQSFPEKTSFRFNLESQFGKQENLMEYDQLSHQYKIKYLYFKCLHTTKQGS